MLVLSLRGHIYNIPIAGMLSIVAGYGNCYLMQKLLKLYKKAGETPLNTIERFKLENPEYKNEKMAYAGRLDPLAEGVLLVLVGDECKNKEDYLGLDKEYEFEILHGVQTDTYDVAGVVKTYRDSVLVVTVDNYKDSVLVGKFAQEYPPFSSKAVGGKSLFWWARKGRLDEVEIPKREVEIYDVEFLGDRKISKQDLKENIFDRVSNLKGDFRQDEILKSWQEFFDNTPEDSFKISKWKIKCSSGTYVRGIANSLGGLAFTIKRTKVFTKLQN